MWRICHSARRAAIAAHGTRSVKEAFFEPPTTESIANPKIRRPRCFLDFSMDGLPMGSVVIELYADVCPLSAENFRVLCTGEMGPDLCYKGTTVPMLQFGAFIGGGLVRRNARRISGAGDSIYGPSFMDENFILKGDIPGSVGWLNWGERNSNSSPFFITMAPAASEGKNQIFGYVVKGLDVVTNIARAAGVADLKDVTMLSLPPTRRKVIIESCGELTDDDF